MTDILPTISKPSRYTGNELHTYKKNLRSYSMSLVRIALAFPDIYDIGMSHLGLKILYSILNSRDDVWAERVYAPWIDMEESMRNNGIPIFSLESSSSLSEFDIIGFSLQYEMSYTTFLNMLDLAQIPLLSKERDNTHPIIMAGGPCTFNPEPVADFFDFFVIGDGEEIVNEIIDCYKENKHLDRHILLEKMAKIDGVYVPLLAELKELDNGTIVVSDGTKIKKRIISDLDSVSYPLNYIVPFMKPIHDRAVVEVMRGCSRGCRFCQAGMIYRPVRERSTKTVKNIAEEIIKRTGYEELSLSSLSTCDHSSIYAIVSELVESLGKDKHVAISLPSLRTDAFSLELAQKLGSAGKTGLTFAPEVATERLKKAVNKNISKEQLLSTAESAFSNGWETLKLYFIIGLPTETDHDVVEIANLIKDVLYIARKANRRAKLSVSISSFVPKAHTPFQWERQLSIKEIQDRQKILIDNIGKNSRIDISFHSPQISFLEGIFARGDRKLSKVLFEAHKLGCRLDGWSELFDFDKWIKAFSICGIEPSYYLRERALNEILPWEHIDTLITRDFLISERNKAYSAEMTDDCRSGICSGCGVCDEKVNVKLDDGYRIEDAKLDINDLVSTIPQASFKIRFHFYKGNEVKYISHLDLINVFTRAFRRAGIPIAYSQGFNPHPKINFASAVPVGTSSKAEYSDIELYEDIDPSEFVSLVNAELPDGIKIYGAKKISLKAISLMAQTGFASYIVRVHDCDSSIIPDIEGIIRSIMQDDQILVDRQQKFKNNRKSNLDKPNTINIKANVKSINLIGYSENILELAMTLSDGGSGKVRPEEIISLLFNKLEGSNIKVSAFDILKTDFYIEYQGRVFSPMDQGLEV